VYFQEVGDAPYILQKQLWGNCSSIFMFSGMQNTGSFYFSIISHFQEQSRMKTEDFILHGGDTWGNPGLSRELKELC